MQRQKSIWNVHEIPCRDDCLYEHTHRVRSHTIMVHGCRHFFTHNEHVCMITVLMIQ